MHLLSGLDQEMGGAKKRGGEAPLQTHSGDGSVQCGSAGCPRPSSHEQKHHSLQTRSTVSICEWCCLLRASPLSVPAMLCHAAGQPIIAFSAELNKYWLHLLTANNPAWCIIYCRATDVIMLSCPLEEAIAKTQIFRFFHGWKKQKKHKTAPFWIS